MIFFHLCDFKAQLCRHTRIHKILFLIITTLQKRIAATMELSKLASVSRYHMKLSQNSLIIESFKLKNIM